MLNAPISTALPSIPATTWSGWPTLSRRNLFADRLCRLPLNPVTHKVQYHAVDTGILEPAFFQVFATNKGAEGVAGHSVIRAVDAALIVAAGRQQLLQLTGNALINREDICRVGCEEIEFMQLQDALQFLDRLRAVVHAQVNEAVVEAAIAALFTNHKQPCRLLAPTVASGSLSGGQSGHQTITQRAWRLLKSAGHRLHCLGSHQNVALAGVILADHAACPGIAVAAGIARRFPLRRDNAHLAAGSSLVLAQQLGQRLFRR